MLGRARLRQLRKRLAGDDLQTARDAQHSDLECSTFYSLASEGDGDLVGIGSGLGRREGNKLAHAGLLPAFAGYINMRPEQPITPAQNIGRKR